MTSPDARLGIVAGMCLLLLTIPEQELLAQPAAPVSVGNELTQQLRADLNEKLNQSIKAQFDGVSLRDAVAKIVDKIEADVIFDTSGIDEEGLTTDIPVTLQIKRTQLPASQVLGLILHPAGLGAVNHNGIVLVTTENRAEDMFYIQVYDVRDLIDEAAKSIKLHPDPECDCPTSGGMIGEYGPKWDLSDCLKRFGGPRRMAMAALIEAIMVDATGPWFYIEGTGGEILAFDGRLVITQTDENHAQIQQILDALRSENDTCDDEEDVKETQNRS